MRILEEGREEFKRNLYRLLLFYKQLLNLLDTFFSGYLLIPDEELNRYYLKLCNKIEEILRETGFEDWTTEDWRPYKSLRTINSEGADIDWEYLVSPRCKEFLAEIESLFVKYGEKEYPLSEEDKQLLIDVRTYLKKYIDYKKNYERAWLKTVEKQAKQMMEKNKQFQVEIPDFDFNFIEDEELKKLLIEDWKEARKAFHNGLWKATVVLSGAILEALLIRALLCIEREAKNSYRQVFMKDGEEATKPPEIERWKFSCLIEIAKRQGIISPDVAKLSDVVRDYRNLIHLWAQKRDKLQVNRYTASALVNLLTLAYKDIEKWYREKG